MFKFFKKKMKLENLGLLEDPRTKEEKDKDFQAEEILFSFAPIEWKEVPESEWRKYPIFNQDGSSSCVAQAVAKCLGIENYIEEGKFVHFSARDIYTRRSNWPDKGMYFVNGLSLGQEGATFEQLMPSQSLNESVMNDAYDRTPLTDLAGRIGRGGSYIYLPSNIDQIASIIEHEKKGVVIGVRFGDNEWDKAVPVVSGGKVKYGHGICATNAILYKGKKALVIEDSWGEGRGMSGRRILTQDWFDAGRIVYAGYYKFFQNSVEALKPSHNFKIDLKYGMTQEPEVVKLQECLAYLGFFPSNVDFTGNFFNITLKAVKKFQLENEISPARGYVGPITREKLNQLFN